MVKCWKCKEDLSQRRLKEIQGGYGGDGRFDALDFRNTCYEEMANSANAG